MIRPFTCLCLAAACGSGLYLYSEKHRTAMLDRDISGVIHETEAARARTGLLRAEWALLNEPGRLQDMADRYLALKPMAPTQFVQLSDLATHLPAPQSAADVTAAEGADDDGSPAGATTDPAPASLAQPDGTADIAEEVILPVRRLAGPADDRLLARADARPKPARHVVPSDHSAPPAHDGLLARGTPLPLAAPQPVGAHIYSAMAEPLPRPAYRPPAMAGTTRYVAPFVGSALGARAALPPPTPYGGDQ